MNTRYVKALGVLILVSPLLASAATITGNETRLELTSAGALAGLGLSVQPVGIGSLEALGPTAVFPITGGTIDDVSGDLVIEHDGSGLTLSAGTDSLMLLNFVIDTATTTIFGDAVIIDDTGGTISASALNDIDLFSFDSSLNVFATATAAGALTSLFGAPDLTGFQIGTATLDVSAVPVPAAVWLMGSALGLIVARRRQK